MTIPRPQFTLRALLVAMLVVAAFFGGMAVQRELAVMPRPIFIVLGLQLASVVAVAFFGGMSIGWSGGKSEERQRLAAERATAREVRRPESPTREK